MIEVWKDIENYPYQVSNLGRVKSLSRTVLYRDGRTREFPEIILKDRMDSKGYVNIQLYSEDKPPVQRRVHRLVAEAFIPNLENKRCVNHKDSIRTNNAVTNLEWATHSENTIHGMKEGEVYKPAKKLSEEQVARVRQLYSMSSFTQRNLGEMFGVNQTQISRIVRKENWKV